MIFAFKSKNIEFDDDLRFMFDYCPASMNDANLEPDLVKMSTENLKIFK